MFITKYLGYGKTKNNDNDSDINNEIIEKYNNSLEANTYDIIIENPESLLKNIELLSIKEWEKILKITNQTNKNQIKYIIIFNIIKIGTPKLLRYKIWLYLIDMDIYNNLNNKNYINFSDYTNNSNDIIIQKIYENKIKSNFKINEQSYFLDILKNILYVYKKKFNIDNTIIIYLVIGLLYNLKLQFQNNVELKKNCFNITNYLYSIKGLSILADSNSSEYSKLKGDLIIMLNDLNITLLKLENSKRVELIINLFYKNYLLDYIPLKYSNFIIEMVLLFDFTIINKIIYAMILFNINYLNDISDWDELEDFLINKIISLSFNDISIFRDFLINDICFANELNKDYN